VHNDASVAALPNVLRERGTRVPEDLSVLSVYSKEFANWFSLPYTSIDSAPEVIGRLAVNVLARRIQRESSPPPFEATLIQPRVIDRGSTRQPVR
jgi:DNA-binding LacI/PurR family transcriptional regulator